MSLDHILLGLLRTPASGYDLGRTFDESARFFWFAELSQIYPTLKRLERDGMLTSRTEPSVRGPARRVYSLTDEGREELRSWLRSGPAFHTLRIPHIAQLFFMDELGDPDETLAFVESFRRQLAERLERYREFEEEVEESHGTWRELPEDEFHRYCALRQGIAVVEARLRWCEETARRIRERVGDAERSPAAPPPGGHEGASRAAEGSATTEPERETEGEMA